MTQTPLPAEIGGSDDSVRIRIGDADLVTIESYECKASVLQQPAAFSLRMGWSDTAIGLLQRAVPGKPFELWVGPRKLQSGLIDARAVPSASSTTVEIRGRDYLGILFDAFVADDQSFAETTYLDLTRKVLDLAGLTKEKGHYLVANNDGNRRFLTGTQLIPRHDAELANELLTGSLGGTGNLVFQTPKTQVGERYYDFLTRQYKLAGLFLWASPDKTFVLAAPNGRQPSLFRIYRARSNRGGIEEFSNVVDCRFNDDTTMRHTKATVFGRSGGGKNGIAMCQGEFRDPELSSAYGIDKNIVIHDQDVKNKTECEFVARRIIAEERRAGWQLEYTVAGHTVFSTDADDGIATWGPDVVVQVDDEELGIHGPFYLEGCTYSRSSSGTTTRLTLMRPSDLIFATGLDGESGEVLQRKLEIPRGKTVR